MQAPAATVELTVALINQQPDPRAIIELPAVEKKWVETYNATSGTLGGEVRLHAEKVLFLNALSKMKNVDKMDKFSFYTAWMDLAISNLTLREGISYIIPYGKKATFIPGWKGRLEQINEMKNVVHTNQPQVVYEGDLFNYSLGEKPKIHDHRRGKRIPGEKITHVYVTIEFLHGKETFIMERPDILIIRDNYSPSYKQYIADCKAAKKEIGETFEKWINANGGFNVTVEPPMWITSEADAFKKTLIKKIYNGLPKLPKQKWLDAKLKDIEQVIDEEDLSQRQTDFSSMVDIATGEMTDGATADAEIISSRINEPGHQQQEQQQQPEQKTGADTAQPAATNNPGNNTQSAQPAAMTAQPVGSPATLFSKENRAQTAAGNAAQPAAETTSSTAALAAEIGNPQESF